MRRSLTAGLSATALLASVFFAPALTQAVVIQQQSAEQADAEPASTRAETAGAAEWNQWRGPDRSGILADAAWPASLSDSNLQKRWSVEMGPSYSGPIVVGDKVFVTETVNRESEVVRALNRETGEELWRSQWLGAMTVPMFASSNGSWIRSTPCYDDGKLFVGGILDVFVCLDAESGDEIWRVDFSALTGSPRPTFGCVCSPMVDGEFLYVQAGGGLCKLKKATGELVWKSLDDGGGMMGSAFSSPVIAEIAGKRQMIVQTRLELCGVDIDEGSKLWSIEVPTFRGMNILTPAVWEGEIFTSTYGGNTRMVTVLGEDDTARAENKWEIDGQGYMSSPVVVDGHAYLTMRNKTFVCFDLETGDRKWSSPRFSQYSSLVTNNEMILALASDGKLILFKANPDRYEQVDVRDVSENSWAHIGVRGNQIFVRELNAITAYDWSSGDDGEPGSYRAGSGAAEAGGR